MSRLVLRGPDAPQLGDVLRARGPGGAALLLAAGRRPKRNVPVDPDEDGVAVVTAGDTLGLVVVDGHRGWAAAGPALDAAADALQAGTGPAQAVQAAHRAALQARHGPQATSRTTLVVATVDGTRLRWASVGDSLLFVGGELLNAPDHVFVGDPDRPPVAEQHEHELAPGATVVVCTDGLTDAIDDPAATVRGALTADPATVADRLGAAVDAAGAQDNFACVVWRRTPDRGRSAATAGADTPLVDLGPDDAGEILTLQRAAYVTEAQLHDDLTLPPLTQTLPALREELADPGVQAFGVRDGDRLVACGRLRTLSGSLGAAEVARLAVAPDRQGEGLGTRLLAEAERRAGPGVRELRLFTGERSAANLRLYARLGYVETGRTPTAAGHALVHLAKSLAP